MRQRPGIDRVASPCHADPWLATSPVTFDGSMVAHQGEELALHPWSAAALSLGVRVTLDASAGS